MIYLQGPLRHLRHLAWLLSQPGPDEIEEVLQKPIFVDSGQRVLADVFQVWQLFAVGKRNHLGKERDVKHNSNSLAICTNLKQNV